MKEILLAMKSWREEHDIINNDAVIMQCTLELLTWPSVLTNIPMTVMNTRSINLGKMYMVT